MKAGNKLVAAATAITLTLGVAGPASAATKVNLGAADTFAILAGSTITSTGTSVVTGDMGLSPGSSITGFPPGVLSGTQHVGDTTAIQAKTDLTAAYTDAAGQAPFTVPSELGSTSKAPGVYDSADGTFHITGVLTLDGQGDPNAVFIFKTASTLVTSTFSSIILTDGAQACNVYWQVGSSATLGTYSSFKGNILALTAATLTTGANVEGRVLARNAAVTLDASSVRAAACAAPAAATTPVSAVTATSTSTTSSVLAPGFPSTGLVAR